MHRRSGLWRHPGFLKLWTGRTVSAFGSQITTIALPLTAVITLQATPAQMSFLRAIHAGSAVLVALFAGVLVDRYRRRPLLVGTDVGFAVVASSIPLLARADLLRMEYLYLVVLGSGSLSMVSTIAGQAFVPSLVSGRQLVAANSQLQASTSAASILGPGLGGFLVELLTAPLAITVDAFSFLCSALCIWSIRVPEPPYGPEAPRGSVFAEIAQGVRAVFGNSLLRPLSEAIAAHFLFATLLSSILILYVSRHLGVRPFGIGLIFGASGPGLLLGSVLAPRISDRLGLGWTLVAGASLNAVGVMLIPSARGPEWRAVAMLALAHFLLGMGMQVHGINLLSLRQAITPVQLQGRVNATFRFFNLGAAAIGALVAAAMSEVLGLRAILFVAAFGLGLPPLRILLSPVPGVRTIGETHAPVSETP